jgi:CheY-like chemotaxis protein
MHKRILIVDDESGFRRSTAIGLRLEGFEVLEAGGGRQALDILRAERVDAALVDLMMPEMNGLELLRWIRADYPDVRLVLTSAYHLSARQLERAALGVCGFVPKPHRLEELAAFLRDKLGVARTA